MHVMPCWLPGYDSIMYFSWFSMWKTLARCLPHAMKIPQNQRWGECSRFLCTMVWCWQCLEIAAILQSEWCLAHTYTLLQKSVANAHHQVHKENPFFFVLYKKLLSNWGMISSINNIIDTRVLRCTLQQRKFRPATTPAANLHPGGLSYSCCEGKSCHTSRHRA